MDRPDLQSSRITGRRTSFVIPQRRIRPHSGKAGRGYRRNYESIGDGAIQTDAFRRGGILRRPPDQPFKNERGHCGPGLLPTSKPWPTMPAAAIADRRCLSLKTGCNCLGLMLYTMGSPASGHGRFAHWGRWVYFSTLQDRDPDQNRERFRLIVAATRPKVDHGLAGSQGMPMELHWSRA